MAQKKDAGAQVNKPVAGVTNKRSRRPSGSDTTVLPSRHGKVHCVLVLGMHRSGTSAATRMLNLLGADLSSNLVGPHESNVSGHWEPADLVRLHDELLASAGSSWEDWRSFNPDWSRSPAAGSFRERIEENLRQDFRNSNLFVLKDPRISRFLPFWRSLLNDAGIVPHALVMVRHPLDVAGSLRSRNNMPQSKALLIWLRHYLDVEFETRGMPRCFVRYEDLLDDWRAVFRRVSDELGVVWPRWSPGSEAMADRFLDPGLRHHRTGDRPSGKPSGLHPWFNDAYQALLRLCSGQGGEADERQLDAIRLSFDEATGALSSAMAHLETELGEQHGLVAHLRQENARLAEAASRMQGVPEAELEAVRQQADRHAAAAQEAIAALEAALAVSREGREADRVAHEAALEELRGALAAGEEKHLALQAERDAQAEALAALEAALAAGREGREADRAADREAHEAALDELRGALAAGEEKRLALQAENDTQAKTLAALETSLALSHDGREADRAAYEKTLAGLRAELAAGREALSALQAERDAQAKTLAALEADLAASRDGREADRATHEAALDELRGVLAAGEARRAALQAEHDAQAKALAALEAELAASRNGREADRAAHEKALAGLRAELAADREALSALRAERAAQAKTLVALEAELASSRDGRKADRAAHEAAHEAALAEVRELRTALAQRDAALAERSRAESRLELELQNERAGSAALRERVEQVQAESRTHLRELTATKALLAETVSRAQALDAEVKAFAGQLSGVQDDLLRSTEETGELKLRLQEAHLERLRQENALFKADSAIAQGLQREAEFRRALADGRQRQDALHTAFEEERGRADRIQAESRAEIERLHAQAGELSRRAETLSADRDAAWRVTEQLRLIDAERLAAIRSLEGDVQAARQDRARADADLAEIRKTLNAALAAQRHFEVERRNWRDSMEFLAELSASPKLVSEWMNSAAQALPESPLFDGAFYAAQAGQSFPSARDAVIHYLTAGWKDGLDPNPLFDTSWYLEQNPDVAASGLVPLLHFVSRGAAQRRFPHPLFDTGWYLDQHPDVAEAGVNPLSHYLMFGVREDWSPNPLFSPVWYRANNPEVAAASVDPLIHYALAGGLQAADPCPLFDAGWYGAVNPDAAASGMTPLGHYLHVGRARGATPNPLFDPAWYLDFYRDVATAGLDPFVHYCLWGHKEQRAPNPFFDPVWYLNTYTDVRDAGVDPLDHYMEHGWRERRDPSPLFSTGWYLDTYPDIAAAGDNPLLHFLQYGRAEGRLARSGDPAGRHVLSHDRGMTEDAFGKWRMHTLACARKPAGGKGKAGRAPSSLLLVFAAANEAEAARLGASAQAIDAAALHSRVERVVFDPTGTVAAAGLPEGMALCTDAGDLAARLDAGAEEQIVCFLRAGDRVDTAAVDALERAGERAGADESRFILFDLYYRRDGSVYPLLLPGVNPTHALNCDYFRSRFAARTRLAAAAVRATGQPGGHATALWIMDDLLARQEHGALAHVALPLVEVPDQKEAIAAERLALLDPAAPAVFVPAGIAPAPAARTGVSVVICTKDKGRLTDTLVRQLLALGDAVEDVVIVSNRTTNPVARATLARLAEHPKVTLVKYDSAYNFAAQSNLGAEKTKGEVLLFLNDDIVPASGTWLEDLLAPLANPEVAVCGPLLLYPDERLQQGGMFLGYHGLAGHTLRNASLPEEDYLFLASAPREVSAVTGAALAIRRGLFEDLNGFDAQLATYLQDVDLCLRVQESGHRIVFTPRSVLLHMESVSLRDVVDERDIKELRALERDYFIRRWGARIDGDRYHNPCFLTEDETLRTLK